MALGTNSIVLHGHLPWIQHPQYDEFLEEDWYLEALIETYLPLLVILDGFERDGIPARLSIGLTPPLLEMLRSPSLRDKSDRHLIRMRELAESEVSRLSGQEPFESAARHYLKRYGQLWDSWTRYSRDLVSAFAEHQDAGRLEILASCATHAVLPLVHTQAARRAQIRIGMDLYHELFGFKAKGFWLPECAYAPGIDEDLVAEGVQWVILDNHGLTAASPPPAQGAYRPMRTPAGLAVFGRDPDSSRQVWAAEVGYPGDPLYRELYRDLGFDGHYEDIKGYLHRDGVRRNIGIKYHRVTGKVALHEKQPWDPKVAKERAAVHAGNYLFNRGEQSRGLAKRLGEPPMVLSPYDMELFGHWWYEGPWFIDAVFRQMADPSSRPPVRLVTPSQVLREGGTVSSGQPPLSTWGEEGYLKVWLNETNSWVLRHQHEIERRMIERARDYPDPSGKEQRILDQMMRELLLLQSSDWAFIITKDTSVHYAKKRVTDHVDRFLALEHILKHPESSIDPETEEELFAEDSLFPGLSYRVILGEASHHRGVPLGTPQTP